MKNIRYYLHALLFSFSAPIAAYMMSMNIKTHAPPNSLWGAVTFCIFFCLVSVLITFVLTRDHLSSGMIASFATLGILYTRDLFMLLITIILTASVVLSILRRKLDLSPSYMLMNILSIGFAVYFGGSYILFIHSAPWDMDVSMAESIRVTTPFPYTHKPDIYYIILDAYGGDKMLQKLHEFDNSGFISALEKRGFVVIQEGKSNYTRTIHSVGSSLNMQYLDSVDRIMSESYLWWPLTGTFANNETRKFLESQGYHTANIASGWSFTSLKDADFYSQPYPLFLNEFERFFVQNTNLSMLGFMGKYGVSIPSYDSHRKTVLYEFQQLGQIATLMSPKFVFVHIVSPHPPFVFDAEGNPIDPDYQFTIADNRYLITPPAKYEKGYLDQVSFVNDQILQAVDAILANSATPPIIILQGDHGPGNFLDAASESPPCFYERYSILNALLLPGIQATIVPQDLTPVNTFRMIFNLYFSANLEFLPNHQYFSTPEAVHYFSDVSDRIDDSCIFPSN